VFTGDLVHSKNQLTPELVEFVTWVLTECATITKTIVILGNHDMLENNLQRLDSLTPIINSLNNPNVVFYKDRGVYEDENVNWCVYSLVQHNIPPEIPQNGKVNIGLFHGPINGLKTDLGYSFGDSIIYRKYIKDKINNNSYYLRTKYLEYLNGYIELAKKTLSDSNITRTIDKMDSYDSVKTIYPID
jgi:hypothetical protein